MYSRMVVARQIERIMERHTRERPFSGWWHPGEGQEAAPIGATAAMRNDDYLFYQGRGSRLGDRQGHGGRTHLWRPSRQGDRRDARQGRRCAALGRSSRSVSWAKARRSAACSPSLPAPPSPRSGAAPDRLRSRTSAMAPRRAARSTRRMVHAAAWKLPLIYFCENNAWLVGTRLRDVSPTENIADYAAGYHIPGVIVDGQDAVAVYEATRTAIDAGARRRRPDLDRGQGRAPPRPLRGRPAELPPRGRFIRLSRSGRATLRAPAARHGAAHRGRRGAGGAVRRTRRRSQHPSPSQR